MKKPKSLPKLKEELQKLVNAYIRQRDEGLPCISCGRVRPLQAGHYFPVKLYDGLRFDEDNIHGECSGCNCFDSSHLIYYTENLKGKIGEHNYSALRQKADDYKKHGYKWSRSELIDMIEKYKVITK